ncbi:hypothetical protein Tco_1269953 [Tanacetum coccineum]
MPVPETVLTICTARLRGQLHTILEDMDRYPNACLEELEAFADTWELDLASNAQRKHDRRGGRHAREKRWVQRIYRNNN